MELNEEKKPLCLNIHQDNEKWPETYQQDRVYSTRHIALSITTSFQPWYLVNNPIVDGDKK